MPSPFLRGNFPLAATTEMGRPFSTGPLAFPFPLNTSTQKPFDWSASVTGNEQPMLRVFNHECTEIGGRKGCSQISKRPCPKESGSPTKSAALRPVLKAFTKYSVGVRGHNRLGDAVARPPRSAARFHLLTSDKAKNTAKRANKP